MTDRETRTEEFSLNGAQLIEKVKELVREGNVRRLTIKNEDGRTILEVPLTLGVVGAALLPVIAAIGAVAALATKCTLVVERADEPPRQPPPSATEG
ncbi:MAG TPA: DUF4342 domain-containing protein [Candidatus Limnocylindria bacterium]|nr:DUF4342 domain-containing protein [Candidatus Limnocylindria bacterium]